MTAALLKERSEDLVNTIAAKAGKALNFPLNLVAHKVAPEGSQSVQVQISLFGRPTRGLLLVPPAATRPCIQDVLRNVS